MCFLLYATACHHAGVRGQTLIPQTSSGSGNMTGSQLWWQILPRCNDPTIWPPGYSLPRRHWSLINHCQTNCLATIDKWPCDRWLTMLHIIIISRWRTICGDFTQLIMSNEWWHTACECTQQQRHNDKSWSTHRTHIHTFSRSRGRVCQSSPEKLQSRD